MERRDILAIGAINNSVTDALTCNTIQQLEYKRKSLPSTKEEVTFVKKGDVKPEYKN